MTYQLLIKYYDRIRYDICWSSNMLMLGVIEIQGYTKMVA